MYCQTTSPAHVKLPASVPYSAVVCIVLSEMSGTGSRALNSPLQLLRTSLVVVGILFVCDNLGFQVKSLIAGISIAGLCSQALLQDAFAFIALTVESPFQARTMGRDACVCVLYCRQNNPRFEAPSFGCFFF